MIGVFSFYATLFESILEKKLTTYIHNLLPRLYNEFSVLKLKKINETLNFLKLSCFPLKRVRRFINKNIQYSYTNYDIFM